MSVFGVFLVRIFPHSDQKKLQIRTVFTQRKSNLEIYHQLYLSLYLIIFSWMYKTGFQVTVDKMAYNLAKASQFFRFLCILPINVCILQVIANKKKYLQTDWVRLVQYLPYLYFVFNICTLLLNNNKRLNSLFP